jgi:hypothetical protein
LLAWLGVTLAPVVAAAGDALEEGRNVVAAIVASPQRGDVAYIKSTSGGVLCENPALCYWAGKDFWVDINTLKILVMGKPQLETDFIANLERCLYPLIQLQNDWADQEEDDWADQEEAPFTAPILIALESHYTEVWRSAEANYWSPRPNCGATAASIAPVQRLSRPENRSLVLPASDGLLMR